MLFRSAGLNAALRLNDHRRARGPAFELTLLDQHPYHLVKIRLHEAAARDAAVSIPLPGLFDGDGPVFHQAGVTGLDFGQRRVDTTTGSLGGVAPLTRAAPSRTTVSP